MSEQDIIDSLIARVNSGESIRVARTKKCPDCVDARQPSTWVDDEQTKEDQEQYKPMERSADDGVTSHVRR